MKKKTDHLEDNFPSVEHTSASCLILQFSHISARSWLASPRLPRRQRLLPVTGSDQTTNESERGHLSGALRCWLVSILTHTTALFIHLPERPNWAQHCRAEWEGARFVKGWKARVVNSFKAFRRHKRCNSSVKDTSSFQEEFSWKRLAWNAALTWTWSPPAFVSIYDVCVDVYAAGPFLDMLEMSCEVAPGYHVPNRNCLKKLQSGDARQACVCPTARWEREKQRTDFCCIGRTRLRSLQTRGQQLVCCRYNLE